MKLYYGYNAIIIFNFCMVMTVLLLMVYHAHKEHKELTREKEQCQIMPCATNHRC